MTSFGFSTESFTEVLALLVTCMEVLSSYYIIVNCMYCDSAPEIIEHVFDTHI